MERRKSSSSHQKRFGQYFSGNKVADLLTALLPSQRCFSQVVDPMAGMGDLLLAANRISPQSNFLGVEIDKLVADKCSSLLPKAKIINSDAFCCQELINPLGWDLVITNPPYVRYQLQDDSHDVMPSKESIRTNLCKRINETAHLSEDDKLLFLSLAQNYSGLSDMAVPAWILCASLVKNNGVLAMVVPDTWLSREYASPIQYMLLKCFDNITIARDVNACWFENALVRTCLVVAERKRTVSLAEGLNKDILQIDLTRELIGNHSLVDNLSCDDVTGFDALIQILRKHEAVVGTGYEVNVHKSSFFFPSLVKISQESKWCDIQDKTTVDESRTLPVEIYKLVKDDYTSRYFDLSSIGVFCGQGLRTGANEFFYLPIVGEDENSYTVKSKTWCSSLGDFRIEKHNIIKSITNRRNTNGLVVDATAITTGLLFITNGIRETDRGVSSPILLEKSALLSSSVSEYIDKAEAYTNNKGLHFKELSAVRPNEKKDGIGYTRFWYMLPALTKRHLPDLCMTRINVGATECLYIPQSSECSIVIDANFSTMWGESQEVIKIAMVLLNSTWSKCILELTSTVMGGGALKVEASHIKKMQFPQYSQEQFDKLVDCANRLIELKHMTPQLQDEIDSIVLSPFQNNSKLLADIKLILQKKLIERGAI